MLSSTLFSKFPTISYNGTVATNISVRLKFDEMVQNNMVLFYPYTIGEGERADVIAHEYYGDSSYTWLIYLANNIQDPLADWPKTEDQLKRHIENAYGSIPQAMEKIVFYRVEWASDDSMLSSAAYTALPQALKKYWKPEYSDGRKLLRYVRAQEDWVIETNKIVKLSMTFSGDAPAVGSYVYQMTAGAKSASGEVALIDGNSVYVKHVIGEFLGSTITPKTTYTGEVTVGVCSNVSLHSSSFQPAVYENNVLAEIPPLWSSEENYWVPVSAYEYEVEINEAKKSIRLIDTSYLDTIERDIRILLA